MHVECMRAKCETSVLRRCHTPGSDLDMAHGARETRYTPYQGKISPKKVYDTMHANTFNTLTQHAETPIRRSTQLTSLGETRPALLAASSLALASESAPMFAPQCGCTFPYTFPSANSSGCCLHMQSILCAPRIRSPHSFQIRSPHTRGCHTATRASHANVGVYPPPCPPHCG